MKPYFSFLQKAKDIALILVILLLLIFVFTAHPSLMDTLIVLNLAVTVIVFLLAALFQGASQRPFIPNFFLALSLFRVALYINATKMILFSVPSQHGSSLSLNMAGTIIPAVGTVVIGRNVVVGVIMCALLMYLYHLVSMESERIASIAARFCLDAMPGKQMAIDSDLNSGLINKEDAREKRDEIQRRADFLGSMDGLGNLLRKEALASGIVLFSSIVIGIIKGLILYLSPSEIISTYTMTSLSSSLLFSIPAVLISKASLLTLMERESVLGEDVACSRPSSGTPFHSIALLSGILGVIELLGLIHRTHFPFFLVTEIMLLAGRFVDKSKDTQLSDSADHTETLNPPQQTGQEREIKGYALISPDTDSCGPAYFILEAGDVLYRYLHTDGRAAFTKELERAERKTAELTGFKIPSITLVNTAGLKPKSYSIRICCPRLNRLGYTTGKESVTAAFGELYCEGYLAIGARKALSHLHGTEISHPVTHLLCKWINGDERKRALSRGCTVRTPEELLSDHIEEVYGRYACRFITASYVESLCVEINACSSTRNAFTLHGINAMTIQTVLQELLKEGVSIADRKAIFDAIIDFSPCSSSVQQLFEHVRAVVSSPYSIREKSRHPEFNVLCFSDETERFLMSISDMPQKDEILSPGHRIGRALLRMIWDEEDSSLDEGRKLVLLCDGSLRHLVKMLTATVLPELEVFSYQEISKKSPLSKCHCTNLSLPSSMTGKKTLMISGWTGSVRPARMVYFMPECGLGSQIAV